MNRVTRHDTGNELLNVYKTSEGYLRGLCRITRTGIFLYKNADGSIRRELRHPDEVFAKDTMASLKMIPITNLHPTSNEGLVSVETAQTLSVGMTGEEVFPDGRFVVASVAIHTKPGVDAVESGNEELSLGYTFERDETPGEYDGQRYDLIQRNIRYNHLALVPKGRAGVDVRLMRADSAVEVEEPMEVEFVCDKCGAKFKKRSDDTRMTCDGCGGRKQTNKDNDETRGVNMSKINLDGKEFEVTNEVNTYVNDLLIKQTSTSKALDALTAERDELKNQLQVAREAHNDQAINALVVERVKLERVAHDFIGDEDISKLSNLDVRKVVILKTSPSTSLDGRSSEYIEARFDAIVEHGLGSKEAVSKQRQTVNQDKGSSVATDSVDEAQKAMRDRLMNAYKNK